jgi:3-isopropylmalate/(R)-2-methylmalate dehydratase small subunit
VIARKTEESPGYGDIFRQNAANCGLLLIEIGPDEHAGLVNAGSGAEAEIDLPLQTIRIEGNTVRFEMNAVTKDALVQGLDLIGTTLLHSDAIDRFEATSSVFVPSHELQGAGR